MITDPKRTEPHPGGPMSVAEYFELDNNASDAKYEYLDGVARLMPGITGEHDQITFNIHSSLRQQLQAGPCFAHGSLVRVLVSESKVAYVYPDVTICCDSADRRRGNTLIRSPRVVVEVLSPSTEKLDRGKKLEAYKAYSTIQEIVLIDQFVQTVEVYRRKADDSTWGYAFYGAGSTVELHSVDVYLALDDVYKGVNFDEPLVDD
jgi:Uma2 family endonuclease